MERWLVPEPGPVSIPNEPARSPSARSPVTRGWRDIQPDLAGDQYVFAAGSAAQPLPPGVTPFAAIREDEGLTLILTRADADRAGLRYSYVAARITLRIASGLTDVGLTALFSGILADAGISCNVIAGLAHDHLFVEWDHGARARDLLKDL